MFSFELLCLHIMLLNIFGSSEDAARDVAERKAVLSLQHDIGSDERLQRLNPAPEDKSKDVWPAAQVFLKENMTYFSWLVGSIQ